MKNNVFQCRRTVGSFLRSVLVAWIGLVVLFAIGTAHGAIAQGLQADVEASNEKGFGRLVFTFKDRNLLPQYVVKASNGVLVIQFGEPIKVDVERIPLSLGNYLLVGRRDPDGLSLRFALARQIKINTMDAGEKLFIDFLPLNWQGPTPPLPDSVIQQLAKRADAALKAQREAENLRFGQKVMAKLDLRVGRQPTFTRFSFGWNVPFDTQMARDNDRVTVTFNRPAAVDLTSLMSDPPPGLKEIGADDSDGKLKITMVVAPEADVRAFREDQTYVVDLSSGAVRPDAVPASVKQAIANAQREVPKNAKDRVSAPGVTPKPGAIMPEVADVAVRAVPLAEAEEPARAPQPAPKPAAKVMEPKTPVMAEPEAAMPKPVQMAEPKPAQMAEAPKMPEHPAPATMAEKERPKAGPVAHDAATPPVGGETRPEVRDVADDRPHLVRAEAKRIGNMVRVSFPFAERVASAAFKRDSSLWLVFDSPLPIDVKAIQAALGDLSSGVVVGDAGTAKTIRIDLTQPALTTLGADGNSWILSVGEMMLEPARPLQLRRFFRTEQQGQLQVDLAAAGMVHELTDPNVGDRMIVVTAFGPAHGLMKEQRFAELQALATAHGIAVIAYSDDLMVSLERDVVTISREKGLSLSPGAGTDRSEAPVPRLETRQKRVMTDPKMLFNKDPGAFTESVRALQASVAEAPEKEKTAKRLELADFYLSHRFAPEALGVLRLIAEDAPGIEREPGFLILFGGAQTMTGRMKEARQILDRPAVSHSADAALWRTIASTGLRKWDDARTAALQASPAIGSYPPDIQAMFALSAAEASTELNDFGPAETRLAEIQPDEIDPDLAVRYVILQGRVMDAAGRPDDAMARLDRAVESPDRRGAAEAEYRRLVIMHRDGKLTPAETIDRLKSLTFGWRGDEIELKALRFLSRLQAASGQYREAFNSMRSAVMVDANADTTHLIQDEMNKQFLDLFLDGKADTLPPVDALTLYYDFRDMTPIGKQGDEIVRNLADRLMSVDLLDQAAELLTYQVDNRLRGVGKAQIAADLAVVHMLNRKPDRALAVLNKTRQSALPVSIERQRRMVEARALSESGRGELAVELLGQLVGSDVDRLKADIAWRAKSWRVAGERLETMLAGRWNDAAALDDQERQDVLKAAIGYALANDQLALDRLRTKFTAKMMDSPNSRAFDVVTSPIQSQGSEFRSVAKQIASVDTMRSFLDEYRQQYLKPKRPNPAKADPKAPAPAAVNEDKTAKPNELASADPAKK